MRCHVLSCSGALRRLRPPCRSFVRPCPACRSSIAFRSTPFRSPRRRCPGRAEPFSARIARGRARVSAPARFARLIARARRRAHFSRAFLRAFFRAGANRKARRPRGCRFLLPHTSIDFLRSSHFQELFQKKRTNTVSGQRRRAALRFEDGKAVDADPIGYHRRTRSADRERIANDPARQTCRSWSRWP